MPRLASNRPRNRNSSKICSYRPPDRLKSRCTSSHRFIPGGDACSSKTCSRAGRFFSVAAVLALGARWRCTLPCSARVCFWSAGATNRCAKSAMKFTAAEALLLSLRACLQCGRQHRAQRLVQLHPSLCEKVDRRKTRRQRAEHCHHLRCGQLRFGVCSAFGLRKSRCLGDDAITRSRMGQISHPTKRHRAGPVSHRRRVVAAHAFQAVRATRQGHPPHEALRPPRRAHQSRAITTGAPPSSERARNLLHEWASKFVEDKSCSTRIRTRKSSPNGKSAVYKPRFTAVASMQLLTYDIAIDILSKEGYRGHRQSLPKIPGRYSQEIS